MTDVATLREIAKQYFTPAQSHNLEVYLEDPLDFELAQAFTLRAIDELSIGKKITPEETNAAIASLGMSERAMTRARKPYNPKR